MADGGVVSAGMDAGAIATALRVSKRAIEMRAAKEGWHYEEQAVRGGRRRHFPLGALPEDVRSAMQRHHAIAAAQGTTPAFSDGQHDGRRLAIAGSVDTAVAQRVRVRGSAAAAGLTGTRKARMDAKLDLLARLAAFAKNRAVGLCAAMIEFCAAYNSGQLTVPHAVRHHTGADLHPATLRRWRKLLKTKGAAALAGEYGNRAGTGSIDSQPELHDFAIGLVAERPHVDATALHTALETRFSTHRIPSERTVQRWLNKWKADNAELLLAVANPDAWKNKFKVAFGSVSEGIVRVNQRWELDSTPGDIDLIDGRHCIIGAIDVATRRMRMHVSKTSSAEGVCSLLRRTILDWGVPEAVKIDNGRDYVSQRVQRSLKGLEIDVQLSAAFSPWEKPHIERGFRTFSHGIFELLSGFIGHNVAEVQELRSRESFADRMFKKNAAVTIKLKAAELQAFCDRWCDELYAHKCHEGLKGDTPFQRAASLRDAVRRIGDVRALDLLLGEAPDGNGMRTVSKKGIKLDKVWFIAPELHALVRQQVLVLYDEADAGRVIVYHEGAFVCIAECPELTGVSRQEIAIEGRLQQNARVSEKRRELKAAKRKANTTDIAWEILDRKRAEAAQLASFPAPNVVHLTPALEAASEAADARDQLGAPAVPQYDPSDPVYDVAALIRRERDGDETNAGRFARALRAMQHPELEIEQQWFRVYHDSSEFRGNWLVFESFGAGAFGLDASFNALLDADANFNQHQGAF